MIDLKKRAALSIEITNLLEHLTSVAEDIQSLDFADHIDTETDSMALRTISGLLEEMGRIRIKAACSLDQLIADVRRNGLTSDEN